MIIGTRIDYILASDNLLHHLTGADISASIIGSDHCPVWATLSFPAADYQQGETSRESLPLTNNSRKQPPRLCARYLSHIAPSQSIRSLFTNVPGHIVLRSPKAAAAELNNSFVKSRKREGSELKPSHAKKVKSSVPAKAVSKDSSTGQRSMSDFLKRQRANELKIQSPESLTSEPEAQAFVPTEAEMDIYVNPSGELENSHDSRSNASQQWTSIFTRKGPPLCDTHSLPCIELVTKKPGPNLGRKFWICSKPVGPGYDNGKSRLLPCSYC